MKVGSFKRDYFSKNTLPQDIEYEDLGFIEHGNYWKRIPILFSAIKKINKLTNADSILYLFSVDMLLILNLFGVPSKKIIYEVGDIRIINGFFASLFDFLYKKCLKKCSEIVVTSEGFIKYLSDRYDLPREKFTVYPNKIENKILGKIGERPTFRNLNSNNFILGIVGLFRYRNIISLLKYHEEHQPQFKIHLYGNGPLLNEIKNYIDGNNVFYFGEFKYPDDLKEIYHQIDISYVMYDVNNLNVRLALPNKLYESIYYKCPMIVSEGTYLAEKVSNLNVGFSWNQSKIESLVKYLNNEDFINNYNSLKNTFDKIETSYFIN